MLTEANLHNYQQHARRHIVEKPFCGLFLDMGLGKTVTTLTAINDLRHNLEVARVLVIAPKRVAESVWPVEVQEWRHLLHLRVQVIAGNEKQRRQALKTPADVYTIGRDNVAWLCGIYGGSMLPFDMVILDESSSFKNPKSIRFKSLKKVRPSLSRLVLLTGTPAPNGLIDLWSQLFLMDRGERLGPTITGYRDKYFKPNQRNGHIVYNYKIKKNAEAAIHARISDACLSMKAEDFLDMPEKVENVIRLQLPPAVKRKYDEFEREQVLELAAQDITAVNAAALSTKLLQYANGAIYDEDRGVHDLHDVKLDALEEIVNTAPGPVLVAWAYQHDRERILHRLKKYKPVQLSKPEHIDQWNAGEIAVLLMHPASGGHGLNLQKGGNILVWFGLTWSLELYQQFTARLYRQGQKAREVFIHILEAAGTLDRDVIQSLKNKDTKQENLLRAIKARIKKYANN